MQEPLQIPTKFRSHSFLLVEMVCNTVFAAVRHRRPGSRARFWDSATHRHAEGKVAQRAVLARQPGESRPAAERRIRSPRQQTSPGMVERVGQLTDGVEGPGGDALEFVRGNAELLRRFPVDEASRLTAVVAVPGQMGDNIGHVRLCRRAAGARRCI